MQIISQASCQNRKFKYQFKTSLKYFMQNLGGGDKKITEMKTDFHQRARSKVGSRDNVTHKPGGGDVKVSK